MSFCSNCGAEVKVGQAICLSCGFALKGNAVPVQEVGEKDYSHRVEHDVLKMWPNFSDGPIGRMNYFKGFAIMLAISFGLTFIVGFTAAAAQSTPMMMIPFTIFALISLVAMVILIAHQIALIYKRFWDMGFEDKGTRVGLVFGYFLVGMIPIVNLAVFAMFFIPGKGKQ